MNPDPRALVVVALGLLGLAGCAARPPLSQLPPLEQAARLAGDRDAVQVYRAGLQAVLAYVEGQPAVFPVARPAGPRLLGRADRDTVRGVWGRFLDYLLALDSVGKYHQALDGLEPRVRAQSIQIAHAAFVAQYRFSLDLLDRFARDPELDALLDEAVPELGLPAGTYARVKLRFLNVARATEFVALGLLDPQPSGHAPDLRPGIQEDRRRIWQAGGGRGELLTAQNAWAILHRAGFAGWFPVQTGVAQWMAHRQLWRPGRALVSAAQLEALPARLEPGDILLVRRNWYLSDIGLPGFWPHAALYVGTPEERRRLGADPAAAGWVGTQGQGDGDLNGLLAARYPEA